MLAADCECLQAVASRLQANVARHNRETQCPYDLSLSIGVTPFHPDGTLSLEAAIARADEVMYAQKRGRQRARDTFEQHTSGAFLTRSHSGPI